MPCDYDATSEANRPPLAMADAPCDQDIAELIARRDPEAVLQQLQALRARVAPTLDADGPEGLLDIRLLDAVIENVISHFVT